MFSKKLFLNMLICFKSNNSVYEKLFIFLLLFEEVISDGICACNMLSYL